MRLTYQPWGETLAELADAGRRAERAGAEVLWASELHRSATGTAAALAGATSTARIGTSIVLAFTRSPMITALEALDLDELSGGRFVIGLGSGVRRLNEQWHNVPFGKPVGHLRETVHNIRLFWDACTTGAEIRADGEFEPMHIRGYERPYPVPERPIPVYLAAMGPLMTRLAGEIGDGWISHELCSPGYLREHILPDLDARHRPRGRQDAPRRRRRRLRVLLGGRRPRARPPPRRRCGRLLRHGPHLRRLLRRSTASPRTSRPSSTRSGPVPARTTSRAASADRMVDALTMAGTRDDVAARIAAYDGIADTVKLSPPTHGLPAVEIRAAQDEIIALIGELTGATA